MFKLQTAHQQFVSTLLQPFILVGCAYKHLNNTWSKAISSSCSIWCSLCQGTCTVGCDLFYCIL